MVGPGRPGWTLHRLRHSALTHLGANGRTAVELQAKSRHASLRTCGRYVTPAPNWPPTSPPRPTPPHATAPELAARLP